MLWSGHSSTGAGTGEGAGGNRGPHFYSHQQPSPTYSWETHAAAARGKAAPHRVHTEGLAAFSWMIIILPVYKSERIGILATVLTDSEEQLHHIPIAGVERRQVRSLQLCWHSTKKPPYFCPASCRDTSEARPGLWKQDKQSRDFQNTQYMHEGHEWPHWASSLPEQTSEDDDFRSCTASSHIRNPLSSDRHPKPNRLCNCRHHKILWDLVIYWLC